MVGAKVAVGQRSCPACFLMRKKRIKDRAMSPGAPFDRTPGHFYTRFAREYVTAYGPLDSHKAIYLSIDS